MDSSKIIQFGIVRSGSTFVYQILKSAFPNSVVTKRHDFVDGECPVVATIRDPRDCLVSAWRVFSIHTNGPAACLTEEQDVNVDNSIAALEPNRKMTEADVDKYLPRVIQHFDRLLAYQPFRVRLLRYEDFHGNENYLFDSIAGFFGVQIDGAERKRILDLFSMERNRERASRFRHFGEYGAEHFIHGMHVFKGAIGGWTEYVPEELHQKVNDGFGKILGRFYKDKTSDFAVSAHPKDRTFFLRYDKGRLPSLRRPFAGVEMVESNFSQAFQDMFVLSVLDGKRDGTYVEIGGNHGIVDNNTYLLETMFGWKGVAFEIVKEHVDGYNAIRKNKCVCANALTVDYGEFLRQYNLPKQIDYLQVDIEPASHTLEALRHLLHWDYRFSVITFETELYSTGASPKKDARSLLFLYGYELVVEDVEILGRPFEDWYVDPQVVSPEIIAQFRRRCSECADCVLDVAKTS